MHRKPLPPSSIEKPAFQQAARLVPESLTPGKPVAIRKTWLRNLYFIEAFTTRHNMTLTQALRAGLITISSDAPERGTADASDTGQRGA